MSEHDQLPHASAETRKATESARKAVSAKHAEITSTDAKLTTLRAEVADAERRRDETLDEGAADVVGTDGVLAKLLHGSRAAAGTAKPPLSTESLEVGRRGVALLEAHLDRLHAEHADLADKLATAEAVELRERAMRGYRGVVAAVDHLGGIWAAFVAAKDTLAGAVLAGRVGPLPVVAVADPRAARLLEELGREIAWAGGHPEESARAERELCAVER